MSWLKTFKKCRALVRYERSVFGSLLLFLALPASLRLLMLHKEGFLISDLRGLAADFVAAALLLIFGSLFWRFSRRHIYLLCYAIWWLLHIASTEYLITFGDMLSYTEFGFGFSANFITDSIPPTTRLLFYLSHLGTYLLFFVMVNRAPRLQLVSGPPRLSLAIVFISTLFLSGYKPIDGAFSIRQSNFFETNLRQFLALRARSIRLTDLSDASYPGEPAASSQPLRYKSLPKVKNVLVVMIEGLSGAFITPNESIDKKFDPFMPKLKKLAEQNLLLDNFVANHPKTSKGIFAIFCGEYPSLADFETKYDRYLKRPDKRTPCLPGFLEGYNTAYVQSATLEFMHKGDFMPLIGFSEIYGREDFKNPKRSGHWGPSDEDIYDKTIDVIERFAQDDKPWFVATLNTSTHYPYYFPNETKPAWKEDSQVTSFRYADDQVDSLVSKLRERDLLKDTIVLITGDESKGHYRNASAIPTGLRRTWSVLAVVHDDFGGKVISENHSHVDIATSLLDLLGKERPVNMRFGRSIFRMYTSPRILYFGDMYRNRVMSFNEEGRELLLCPVTFKGCTSHIYKDNHFLNHGFLYKRVASPEKVKRLASFVSYSDG